MRIQRWAPPPIMSAPAASAFFRPDFAYQVPIVEGERIFAIGSCFARNVEGFLLPHFQVPSRLCASALSTREVEVHRPVSADLTYLHRYNVFSIRHNLEWALEPSAAPVDRLLPLAGERLMDPYAGASKAFDAADAEDLRLLLDKTMSTVRDCRVVIITLGLSEVWEDMRTGFVMNIAPTADMWRAYPGRFRFRVANCAETLAELGHVYRLLHQHCIDNLQIIVSVSPIPLLASFRAEDIVVSNTASKAVLRAAVDQRVSEHDDADARGQPSLAIHQ